MFSLSRIVGTVPIGTLQPSQIQIVGAITCPPGNGGVPVELRITAPPGGPTTTFTATTNTGGATGPAESVTFLVPAWAAAVCGQKISFEVRGNCGGQWTAWQAFTGEIDCLGPRISLQSVYGQCSGTPARQAVTLTATVMNPTGTTTNFTWDFGDSSIAPAGMVTNSTNNPNTISTLTSTHDFASAGGPYIACLKPPMTSECPNVYATITPDCNTGCCDEVTVAIDTQPLPCLGTGGGPVCSVLGDAAARRLQRGFRVQGY